MNTDQKVFLKYTGTESAIDKFTVVAVSEKNIVVDGYDEPRVSFMYRKPTSTNAILLTLPLSDFRPKRINNNELNYKEFIKKAAEKMYLKKKNKIEKLKALGAEDADKENKEMPSEYHQYVAERSTIESSIERLSGMYDSGTRLQETISLVISKHDYGSQEEDYIEDAARAYCTDVQSYFDIMAKKAEISNIRGKLNRYVDELTEKIDSFKK